MAGPWSRVRLNHWLKSPCTGGTVTSYLQQCIKLVLQSLKLNYGVSVISKIPTRQSNGKRFQCSGLKLENEKHCSLLLVP